MFLNYILSQRGKAEFRLEVNALVYVYKDEKVSERFVKLDAWDYMPETLI